MHGMSMTGASLILDGRMSVFADIVPAYFEPGALFEVDSSHSSSPSTCSGVSMPAALAGGVRQRHGGPPACKEPDTMCTAAAKVRVKEETPRRG